MAHEWIMCVGQSNHKHNPAYSNWYALDAWVKEYGILNGTALTDTISTDCFLRDFQLTYALRNWGQVYGKLSIMYEGRLSQ